MLESITSVAPVEELELTTSPAQEQKSQFLQLLIAQMKGQDPLNPMDGTQFVAQLAQFSSLEELINIREVMEKVHQVIDSQDSGTSETYDDAGREIFEA